MKTVLGRGYQIHPDALKILETLEEELTVKEEKKLEELEKENLKIIEGVYTALIRDKEIQELIEKIKSHELVKLIEE